MNNLTRMELHAAITEVINNWAPRSVGVTKEQAIASVNITNNYNGATWREVPTRFQTKRGGIDFRAKAGARLAKAFGGDKVAAAAFVDSIIEVSKVRYWRHHDAPAGVETRRTFSPAEVLRLRAERGPQNGRHAKKYIYIPELGGARLCSPVYGLRDYNGGRVELMSSAKCELINRLMGWRD